MLEISIEAFGFQHIVKEFRALGRRPVEARPILRKIGNDMTRVAIAQFQTEGRYSNQPWAPLKPATIARKTRLGAGDKTILRRTDRMYQSLIDPGNPEHFVHATDSRVDFGSHVEYADLHNIGTKFMPPRPIIEITDKDRRRWVRGIERYILKGELRLR